MGVWGVGGVLFEFKPINELCCGASTLVLDDPRILLCLLFLWPSTGVRITAATAPFSLSGCVCVCLFPTAGKLRSEPAVFQCRVSDHSFTAAARVELRPTLGMEQRHELSHVMDLN